MQKRLSEIRVDEAKAAVEAGATSVRISSNEAWGTGVFENVNLSFEGIEGEGMLMLLDMRGICASTGSACASGSLDPSHVLLATGLPHEIAHGSLRLSFGAESTVQEAQAACEALLDIVPRLRAMSPVWDDIVTGKKPSLLR